MYNVEDEGSVHICIFPPGGVASWTASRMGSRIVTPTPMYVWVRRGTSWTPWVAWVGGWFFE